MKYLILALIFVVISLNAYSEENVINDSLSKPKTLFEMQKNPTTAILLSLAFPGAGQVYNENYWKAPVFAVGAGVLVYLIIDNNTKYSDYQALYDKESAISKFSINSIKYKSYKEYYRDMRDQSAFYLVGIYILSAVDAYAGAHLFDFNVSDQVKLNINPVLTPVASLINLQFHF